MDPVMCPNCGRPVATEKQLPEYRYKECGLPNVTLHGGVTRTDCPNCGQKHVRVRKEGQLLQVLALMLLTTPRRLTGPEMKFLRGVCQLSQARLAEVLKHRRETVAERESKKTPNVSEAEETWFRLAILNAFREQLSKPGRNLLAKSHMQRLNTFTQNFYKKALELAEREIRRLRLSMRLEPPGDEWQLMDRAA